MNYNELQITNDQAESILHKLFRIRGKAKRLPGEVDFNFKIETGDKEKYILKISRPEEDLNYLDFQQKLLQHIAGGNPEISVPRVISDPEGNALSFYTDASEKKRAVRLLSWISGRLWADVNPITRQLRNSLGEKCALLTKALSYFEHEKGKRKFDWDIAQSLWTKDFLHLFDHDEKEMLVYFQQRFEKDLPKYDKLRKSVIHNDANDNNIIVSSDLNTPEVLAVIDYGDAVYTQIINDLSIAITYAVMQDENPLESAAEIVKGYHSEFPLTDDELKHIYNAVGMRLAISLTKSAINKIKEPENKYLLISEQPAKDLLKKWFEIAPEFAYYSFRNTCGFKAHPNEKAFVKWTEEQSVSIADLFPKLKRKDIIPIDLSVSSKWLGHKTDFFDVDTANYKFKKFSKQYPGSIPGGGYLEPRPFYTSPDFERTGNNGRETRSIHLGIDLWVAPGTDVSALFDGEIFVAEYHPQPQDYGGVVVVKHNTKQFEFYALYGHLSKESIKKLKQGRIVKKGDILGNTGTYGENGNWIPHLHFQLMLSLLDLSDDFPGVAFQSESQIWKSICPDPNLLLKSEKLSNNGDPLNTEIIAYRKTHLGKGLSLQYDKPLRIVRGDGQYLIDQYGRKYLDTVNNVAHVGHEQIDVVRAGQEQMALLNTNTRYLHENIIEFAGELLDTLPEELSVLHFVNSGSEANELALRMVKTATGQKDIIASEVGYHGNTSACIDISSYKFDGKGGSGAPEHTHIFPLPDVFRGKYRGQDAGEQYAREVQKLIDEIHQKGRKVAALIVEPIISCGGQIELPEGFLKKSYNTVRNAGGLCISDEVQVGCGRVGEKFWGFELYDVIPDIITIGKPLGNGHPLAAVACTKEVAEKFSNGMEYFNTFGGNPVSCAIGTAVLKVVKRDKLQQNALKTGNYLKKELKNLAEKFPIIGDVRGRGLFLGFELVDRDLNPLALHAKYLVNRMKENGILMSIDGPDYNVIKIKPPIMFTPENCDEVLFYLGKIFDEDFMKSF